MAFLGLVSQREHNKLLAELTAIKNQLGVDSRWLLSTAQAEKFTLPDPAVYGNQADLYRKLSWVMLAIDLVANAASLTPFEVKRITAGKEPKDIPNHDFELLLNHPNPMDSRYEFLYSSIAFYKLTGNCYWWLNKADRYAKPDEMWMIPSQLIQPQPDGNLYLDGYVYYPPDGSKAIALETWEIVHFKRFNPFSRFVGLSAIEAIALVAMGDLAMQDWNTRLFGENNARLPGILTFKNFIEDSTWQGIKADTREASKKRDLMLLRGVGEGGVKWLQNAVSQREMEFLSGREANQKEIMTAIAPGSYSMLSENATQANSVVGRASFNELSVYPVHVMFNEKITNDILPLYGSRLIGAFEDIRVTDKELKLREQDAFERSHTVKEVREEIYGDEPLGDERDNLFVSQITSGSMKAEEEKAPTPPENNIAIDKSLEQKPTETQPDDVNDTKEAVKKELGLWRRKAIKNVGKAVKFESDIIPDYVREQIERGLSTCKNEADVKRVFTVNIIDESQVMLTVNALRQALNFKVR